ncbi:hypothetical protein OOA_15422, partial [Providencia burhodogranariea DSM 19968]
MNIKIPKPTLKSFFLLIIIALVSLLIWYHGDYFYLESKNQKQQAIIGLIIVSYVVHISWLYFIERRKNKHRETNTDSGTYPDQEKRVELNNHNSLPIIETLKNNYGTFWYKKVSIQLLVGNSSAVDKLAPHLSQEIWQESNGTVLIYAGDVATGIDEELIHTLQQLRRRRPLDGVIWVTENTVSSHLLDPALSFNHLNAAVTDMAARVFHNLFNALKWRAPVWFWSVSDNTALQASEAPSVVYLTEPGMRAEALSPTL